MKTTLIQIDPHDDLTSIKDKMTWSRGQRMILFFPRGFPLDQSPLTMKLIRRYAESNGSQVAIVTKSKILKEISREQGIPFFSSAPEAERKAWKNEAPAKVKGTIQGIDKVSEKKVSTTKPKVLPPKKIFQKSLAIILLLGLVVISLIVVAPSATVILYPIQTDQDIEYQVYVDPEKQSVDLTGILPGIRVSVEISGELSAPSSGKLIVPKTKANGEVTITNLSTKTVMIPKGTIVSTDGQTPIEFYLKEEVVLPPGSEPVKGIPIEAIQAGLSGNVDVMQINTLGGFEGVAAVTNPEATKGGTEQTFPTPTDADYEKIEKMLREQLYNRCRQTIEAQKDESFVLIEQSIVLGEKVSRNEIPAVGIPSDQATLELSTTCEAVAFSEEDEKKLAEEILNQNIEKNMMPANDEIVTERVTDFIKTPDGRYSWTGSANRYLIPLFEKNDLAGSVSGKSIAEADQILVFAFTQLQSPEILVNPSWWKVLPFLPNRIHFELRGKK